MSNLVRNALGGSIPMMGGVPTARMPGPVDMVQQFMQFAQNVQKDPQMAQEFQKFKNNYSGNPQETIMKMMQSGQLTQDQLGQMQKIAR